MAKKQAIITLYDGDPIKIIGSRTWGGIFPDGHELNERIKSGDRFVSVKVDDEDEIYTFHIDNIKSVKEITLEEEEQNGEN